MDLQSAASAFVKGCASIRKLSPHTVRAYELDLASFAGFVGRTTAISAWSELRCSDTSSISLTNGT